jgi:hypothetical protein
MVLLNIKLNMDFLPQQIICQDSDGFANCRVKKARKLFARFERQQKEYFSYVDNVGLDPDELVVKSPL